MADEEKAQYDISSDAPHVAGDSRKAIIAEAASLYGDAEAAEHYGYVSISTFLGQRQIRGKGEGGRGCIRNVH